MREPQYKHPPWQTNLFLPLEVKKSYLTVPEMQPFKLENVMISACDCVVAVDAVDHKC